MSLDDNILKMFIDEVFQVYDYDRSGQLDVNELHTFLNQLYISLNEPRRFTAQQTQQLITQIDLQRNGRISKPELFLLFKNLTSVPNQPQGNLGGYNYPGNNNNYGQQGYNPYSQPPPNQYAQQPPNPYGNQAQYQKYGQPYQQPAPYGQQPPNYNYGQPQQPNYYPPQNNQGNNPNQYNPYNPYK